MPAAATDQVSAPLPLRACWVVMLGLAIWIIIVAPRCEPMPTITWLQESAMLQVDVGNTDAQGEAGTQTAGLLLQQVDMFHWDKCMDHII